MITTDLDKLRIPVPVSNFESNEAEVISAALFSELTIAGGLGLSANQIGLSKRVCVINVKEEPLYLINPQIVETSEERFTYYEGCLSIPKTKKKLIKTERFEWVKVRADNLADDMVFGPDSREDWDANPVNFWNDVGFLQSVVIQHEIDHLNGITIKDRVYSSTVSKVKKYGRNEQVMFMNVKTGDAEFMKYKHGIHLLGEGWEVK